MSARTGTALMTAIALLASYPAGASAQYRPKRVVLTFVGVPSADSAEAVRLLRDAFERDTTVSLLTPPTPAEVRERRYPGANFWMEVRYTDDSGGERLVYKIMDVETTALVCKDSLYLVDTAKKTGALSLPRQPKSSGKSCF